jgi:membrane protein YdbS with pleckstrin-like domain
MNVKAIRNLRALGKVGVETEISKTQIWIAIVLLISLFISFYLFWIGRFSETVFATQSSFLIALFIFIFLYHQLVRFKAGPIEFEKSTERRTQPIETISKIER